MTEQKNIREITTVAVCSAVAFLLQIIGSMIGLKVGGFLEIEFSDIPALIVSFALGPVYGVVTEFVKNILHCPFTTTGFVGELANFCVTGVFVAIAGFLYKLKKTRKNALLSMIFAVVGMTVVAMLSNYFIMLPLYMPKADAGTKIGIVLKLITPFNVGKGVVISLITFVLYKRLTPIIKGKK